MPRSIGRDRSDAIDASQHRNALTVGARHQKGQLREMLAMEPHHLRKPWPSYIRVFHRKKPSGHSNQKHAPSPEPGSSSRTTAPQSESESARSAWRSQKEENESRPDFVTTGLDPFVVSLGVHPTHPHGRSGHTSVRSVRWMRRSSGSSGKSVSWIGLQIFGARRGLLTCLRAHHGPTNRPGGQGGADPHRELSNPELQPDGNTQVKRNE